jgi:hypothetical protein
MKVLIVFFLSFFSLFSAQGRHDNADAIQGMAGIAQKDEMIGKSSYSHIFGESNWMGRGEILYKDLSFLYTGDQNIKLNFYGANAQIGYSIEVLSPVLLNFWAGFYGGYEIINNNKNQDPYYHAPFPYGTKAIRYGVSLEPELEINLGKTISLVSSYSQYFSVNSKYIVRDYGIFIGAKFYINN